MIQMSTELDVAVQPEPEGTALDVSALFRCLGGLDVRARTILQLSFHDERSAEEIAGALETTSGNVRVVRHRAMKQLRDCLESGGAA